MKHKCNHILLIAGTLVFGTAHAQDGQFKAQMQQQRQETQDMRSAHKAEMKAAHEQKKAERQAKQAQIKEQRSARIDEKLQRNEANRAKLLDRKAKLQAGN